MELDTTLVSTHISKLLGERFSAPVANPISGGEYSVIMLIDESGEKRISVRIPKAPPGAITSLRLDLEAQIRQRINDAKLDRFQPLLAYDITVENPICRPFMALGWADGRQLEWSPTTPKCAAQRESVLRAIANTSLDLLQVQQPGMTAWDWMTNKINRKVARADTNDLPFGTKAQCEQQKSLMQKYWMPDFDNCPHVLVHGDLSSQNIIVDDDFAVRSIIDLGWAELVPLQFAVEYPRFLQIEPLETDSGICWVRAREAQYQKDRQFYLSCIRDRAELDGGLANVYYRVLSRTDELNRYWWCAAASRADAHKAMARCNWNPLSFLNG